MLRSNSNNPPIASNPSSTSLYQASHAYQHNIINICGQDGLSLQQSFDHVSDILNACYRRWHMAVANMPIYGEQLDRQIYKYIENCRNIALANVHWQ